MAAYNTFSKCYDFLGNIYEKASEIKKDVAENVTEITNILTKQNIASIMSIIKDTSAMQNIDKITELTTVIDKLISVTNINKFEFDVYNTDKTTESGEGTLSKLITKSIYNNPKYLYYYTLPENNNKPLPYSKITLLSLKINPVHFYLNDTLVKLFQQFCIFAAFFDCFITIKNVPRFFTEYFAKLGLNGIFIYDIEIILALLTKLLLLDLTKDTFPEYNSSGEIIKINNVFDILFKWSQINKSSLLKNKILAGVGKPVFATLDIDKKINDVIAILLNILTDEATTKYKSNCQQLYDAGLMTISVYIAYLIKSFKIITPVLSFSHLGYIEDLADTIILNAKEGLKQKGGQKGGIIGLDNAFVIAGVIGSLKDIGLIKVIDMIFDSLKPSIYTCMRSYYSKKKLDMSKNISFTRLSLLLSSYGNNVIINMITGVPGQPKLEYLSMFFQSFSINDTVTKMDKLLLMPYVCNVKLGGGKDTVSPFTALEKSYAITHKLIKAPNTVDTGLFVLDMINLVLSENVSLFKIYDTLISKFAKCEIYKFTDEMEHIHKLLFSFIKILNPDVQIVLRHKILAYIIIQNLFLLAEKYKQAPINHEHFYTMSKQIDANKIKIFDHNIIQLCRIISNIICVKPGKSDSNLDVFNDLIMACLGKANDLFNEELTDTLVKLVNYNYIIYRIYVANAKQAIISKTLLISQLQTKPVTSHNTKKKTNSSNFFDARNTSTVPQPAIDSTHRHNSSTQNSNSQDNTYPNIESEYNTSFFALNLLSDIGKKAYYSGKKKLANTTTKANEYMINAVTSAKNIFTSLLTTPAPNLEPIVTLNNSISSISETQLDTVTNTIEELPNNITQELMHVEPNDNHITNKQKIHVFLAKLFEYVLYVSLPQLEAKLEYNITDNIMVCPETDVIINHLLDPKSGLLFETSKQRAKVKFLKY